MRTKALLGLGGRGRVLRRAYAPRFDPAHGRITFGEYAEGDAAGMSDAADDAAKCGQIMTRTKVVEMEYVPNLADPLVDVRDVVESFRSSHLILPDWDQTLRRVVAALSQLPPQGQVDVVVPGLVPNLRLLLAAGLDNVPQVVDMVADQVAVALERTRVPGIPAPEDDDWSFGETTVS